MYTTSLIYGENIDSPLISIIIPVYKASAYINAALESIRQQTCDSWELIAVEDA
jgi:glycosyltransferase involved in cell wall biosynthesis